MNNSLDISIHGPQRVAIVEQLVHICRYTPGLVLLDGDAGKSPVNFLRDMADLLKDELDFALLDNDHCDVAGIASELVSQWYIYQVEVHEQTDIQSVHHYLDLGLQSGRLALIVIERTSLLADDAINFLVSMMARHSRLTILFAGIVDARPLLRRAQQAEVPINRIDIPDSAVHHNLDNTQAGISPSAHSLSSSQFDHTFSDDSYELPEDDMLEDDLGGTHYLAAGPNGRREPVIGEQYAATQSSLRFNASDSRLGVSTRLSAIHEMGAATLAGFKKTKSSGALLLAGCLAFVALVLLFVLYPRDADVSIGERLPVQSIVTVDHAPPASMPPPPVIASLPSNNGGAPVSASSGKPDVAGALVGAPESRVPEAPPAVSAAQVVAVQPVVELKQEKTKGIVSAKTAPSTEKQWRTKPDNYTVQVAAAHSETNIKALESKLPPNHPHYIYRTTRGGKPWFILIYGSFSGKQAAAVARDSLPADIKKGSAPWLRKQGEVFSQ